MEGISEDSNTSLGQRSGNDEEWIIIYLEFRGEGTVRFVELKQLELLYGV